MSMQFTPIKMDVNGNSRVVVSWINFGTDTYAEAITLSHKLGGRKYHNKSYGGGIVFQCTDTDELERQINKLRASQTHG